MCVANYCNTILFPRTWHYIKIYTNIKRSTAFIIENILRFILFSICMLDTGHPHTHLLHPIHSPIRYLLPGFILTGQFFTHNLHPFKHISSLFFGYCNVITGSSANTAPIGHRNWQKNRS